ncbi:MAG: iron ABC transporter permease [Eggerthellaceae bacterium]|nr:iron ABC transporter permease [Eggerthellaceae bacterium]
MRKGGAPHSAEASGNGREALLARGGNGRGIAEARRRAWAVVALLGVLLAVAFVASLGLGRFELFEALWGPDPEKAESALYVLFGMRLPRVMAAACVGAMLALAGCAYQGLFRNPMVSPDILGASAGAGFGAALGILLSLGGIGVQVCAFITGVIAVAASYSISQRLARGMNTVLMLVLCGMVVQNLFTAFTSAVKFVADPNSQLPEITFWLMGGLANVTKENVWWLLVPLVVGGAVLFSLRWKLNVMSLGDEEALALGVNTKKTRLWIVGAATLVTSSAVSVAGMVGWVGLIIPHLARFLVGPDNRVLVPVSFLLGAVFLLLVDDVCRSIYTTEIPISIFTAIIGAPLFVYLIYKSKAGAS